MKTDDLIQSLVKKHESRPFWKVSVVLTMFWLLINAFSFALIFFFMKNTETTMSLSSWTFHLIILAATWFFFLKNLNYDFRYNTAAIAGVLLLIVISTSLGLINGDIHKTQQANFSFSEFNCFRHILLATLPSLIFFPFVLKNFYVFNRGALAILAAGHLGYMSLALIEFKCQNRDFWHLILGHDTAIPVLVIVILLIIFLGRRLKLLTF